MAPETSTDRQELEKLREEVAEQEKELLRRAFEIGRLSTELGHAMQFERTLSWRLTKPVRLIGALVRGKLRR